MDRSCPECGSPVESDLACHTWPRRRDDGTEQWMACMPCDSATIWECVKRWMDDEELEEYSKGLGRTAEPCDWHWTEGLNPSNPRAQDNETRNPYWSSDE